MMEKTYQSVYLIEQDFRQSEKYTGIIDSDEDLDIQISYCPEDIEGMNVIAKFDGYENRKEDDKMQPFNNPYCISKLETENLIKSFCQQENIDYIIIRPGNVYGPFDYTSTHILYSKVYENNMI